MLKSHSTVGVSQFDGILCPMNSYNYHNLCVNLQPVANGEALYQA